MKKSFKELLCFGLIGIFYIFAVLKSTIIPMHVPVKDWQFLLIALAAFLFYCLVDTRPGRIVFLSAVGVGVGFAAYTVIRSGFESLPETFAPAIELGRVMLQVGSGYYNEKVSDTLLMWSIGIFSLVVAIPVYYFLVHRFRFYLLIVPGIALFMTLWGMFRHVDIMCVYIFIAIAIVCFIYHKYTLYGKKNTERKEAPTGTNIIIFFTPVAIIIVLLITTFSYSDQAVRWPWLDEKINNLYWDMHARYDVDRYDRFSLAHTGLGDASRLGGPARLDNTAIMVVQAPARVYLRGAVYDDYTGLGWIESERPIQNDMNDRTMDFQELHYGWKASGAAMGINNIDKFIEYLEGTPPEFQFENTAYTYLEFLRLQRIPMLLSRVHPEQEMIVRHLNVRTKTLFAPLKTYVPIYGLEEDRYIITESVEGTFEADKRLPGESQYQFDYLQPAYGMEVLERYFNASSPGAYRAFIETNEAFVEKLEENEIYNPDHVREELQELLEVYYDLENHRNEIYEHYLKLPEGLPERVTELAQSLTDGPFPNTYSKVKSLENYLRNNYSYTFEPQLQPDGRDFVEYFLFDGKEGYCSYYASALCVLTRAVGIPSRYVEGFVMPETTDENGFYHVTNMNAHAWAEVYLEGVGWVTFEATPPFAGVMNYTVSLEEVTNEGYSEAMIPEYFDPAQYMEDYVPGDIDLSGYNRREISSTTVMIWIGSALGAVMLLNLLFSLLRRLLLKMMSPAKSVPRIYKHLVSLLKQVGCITKPGETPKDFAQRVDTRFQFTHMSMLEMVEIFYSVRFGAHPLDKKTLKHLFAFVGEAKAKSGRTMYFFKRILLRGLLFRG